MNVYPVKIEWNGAETIASLKLDLKHIRELCAKTEKDILDIITDAPTNLLDMGTLLDAALRWKGNENPADLTGDDLFDALVEQGKSGMGDWMKLCADIAAASGILSGQQAAAMVKSVHRIMEQSIQKLENGTAETQETPEDPIPAAGK